MTNILDEIRKSHAIGKPLSTEELMLLQMIEIKEMLIDIDTRLKVVERQQIKFNEYPPLTWLLRYQTKSTIMWLLFAFMVLSAWFVSDFRKPILQFFGLPSF